jgi:hypothetical protein
MATSLRPSVNKVLLSITSASDPVSGPLPGVVTGALGGLSVLIFGLAVFG